MSEGRTLRVEEFDATGTPMTQWSIQTTGPFDACTHLHVIAVQKLLGHASLATTQRYLDQMAPSELRAAVPPLPLSVG